MRYRVLALALSLLAVSCTSGEPRDRAAEGSGDSVTPKAAQPGAGLLVIRRARHTGLSPTEGSLSSVTIRPAEGPTLRGLLGDVQGAGKLVRRVLPGDFTIRHIERPCDGSCGALDEPINRCGAAHRLEANARILITIRVSYDKCDFRFSRRGNIARMPTSPRVFARVGAKYKFHIRSHCGIGYPIEFDGRFWVPTLRRFRKGRNAPPRFDFNTDVGAMTLMDNDTARYESSGGTFVMYKPFLGLVKLFLCY